MSDLKKCPNCNSELKKGLIKNVELLSSVEIDLINEYNDDKSEAFCSKCGKDFLKVSIDKLKKERIKLGKEIQDSIASIPVITTHSPLNWDYDVLEMVTAQSATGTGFLTEIVSTFTDIVGDQSEMHNKKLKGGENICFAQLRKQVLDLGGNAVIATDIDYSEIGGNRGILMVCMAGTAIKLKNTKIIGEDKIEKINNLSFLNDRLNKLSKYKIQEDSPSFE
jgi:uncharacterized protein YbjQ (UPF0145 family)